MKIKLTQETRACIANERTLDIGSSEGFWYDLTKGGYFSPDDVMADPKQIKKMQEAIDLVQELEIIYDRVVAEF